MHTREVSETDKTPNPQDLLHPAQKMLFQGKQEQPPGFPFLPNCRLCLGNHLTVNIGNAMALASGHTNASQVQSLILSGVVTGMPRQWCRPHCGHQHAGGLGPARQLMQPCICAEGVVGHQGFGDATGWGTGFAIHLPLQHGATVHTGPVSTPGKEGNPSQQGSCPGACAAWHFESTLGCHCGSGAPPPSASDHTHSD